MRTTVALPDDLLSKARKEALETGRSLAVLVEEALREKLARRPGRAGPTPSSLPTFGRGGLQPGVDLDDSASLLDLMDGDAPSRR